MVENSTRVQSSDPSPDELEDINDPIFAHYRYTRPNAAETDHSVDELVPLFLSNQSEEYRFDGNRPSSITLSRVVAALFVAAAAAMGFALLPVDAVRDIRDIIVDAKASLTAIAPVQARVATQAAVKAPVQPVAHQPVAHNVTVTPPDQPSRDEITTAYQAAIKSLVVAHEPAPAASPVAPPAPPTARRLDPDELEALLKRARSLLAIGDIAPARLLLARAADAQEADAALMLARTYDPEVLGTSDARSVTPDPEEARIWYRRAADLGSQRAQQRLAQMQN
jgi:hypothetical protein